MEREELYKLVKEALGSTQLIRVTKRTIEGELDDELDNFGEDEEKNSELVAKIANRLKRMEGNLQHDLAEKIRSEEHTSELQSRQYLVCRLLLEKKKLSISRSWLTTT